MGLELSVQGLEFSVCSDGLYFGVCVCVCGLDQYVIP